MKKFSKEKRAKILRISYLISIALAFVLFCIILTTRQSNYDVVMSGVYSSIDNQWTLTPDGNDYVDLTKLGQYFKDGSDTLTIYYRIPHMEYDKSLIFRSKDVYCTVYVGDKLIYSPQIYESAYYNASPGNNWNFITLPSNSSGQRVSLKVKYIYGPEAVTIDNTFWGNRSEWILDFIVSKILAVFLSALIITVGIFIMAMDYNTYRRSQKHSLLYLGIYAILMGLWSLVETNVLQILFPDGRFIQLLDNVLMITDSLPLFFYLDAEFDILRHKALRILTIMDIIYIYICIIGQMIGLTDLHNLLQGSWIATGLSFIILLCILIKQIGAFLRGEKINKAVLIQICGFLSLMILVVICLPIFINSDGIDRAESIRIGMLSMIIMFAIAAQLQTYELIKQGTRYDIVKNLAYQDALTGLRNRTSYLETLDKYKEEAPAGLGVIFFDVNNLKTANDKYGHEVGDQLICSTAEVIRKSFADLGTAYRTGGDEFIVFIESAEPRESYEKGMELFDKELKALNKLRKYPFNVEIAHGFAISEYTDEQHLKSMINTADENMYNNKRILKEKSAVMI